ncbi:hypothetical protein BDP55DRAFT_630198 [Colletotrichum godetiae]|uniref:Uncharacterized protein n=1 Tax=Colletotrichum godetiae TaxID=1209918 RepID=A0AAJ0ASM6_9PEZI|nr:uncharacterized protein BDP55DRAFT_630198 [Colletotrichum godetiae]KAK1688085.1 hypothetical protein BDP55DRAFT_630198 [Colletotrichum godetiae]
MGCEISDDYTQGHTGTATCAGSLEESSPEFLGAAVHTRRQFWPQGRWRAAEEHPPRGSKSHAAHARMSALAPHSPSHPSEQEGQVRREVHAANEASSLTVAVELCLT